jgi:Ca2+-binding EF-hand superfamily protein
MVDSIGAGSFNPSSIIQQMQDRRFNAMDKNGDGKIDKNELSQMLTNNPRLGGIFGQMLASGTNGAQGSPSVDDIFSKLDTDKDGTISKNELTTAMDQIRSKRHGHHHHAQGISNSGTQDNNSSSASISQILNGLSGTDANSALKIYLQSSAVSSLSSASSQGTPGAGVQTSLVSTLAALYA